MGQLGLRVEGQHSWTLTVWGQGVGEEPRPQKPPSHPFPFPSLVSCEIDNQAAKPLAAGFALCPALEEIL